ncbi:MAG: thioredoxin family protein [Planctomycetota bacterium]
MRCISGILLFVILLTPCSGLCVSTRAADRPWGTDPEKALQTAAQTGRPVFMQFSASWCAICKRMEKSTLTDPDVAARISRNYVPVRVDADRHSDLVKDLEIKGLPAILIVSPELEILHRISGFQTVDAMLTELDAAEQAAGRSRPATSPRAPRSTPAKATEEFSDTAATEKATSRRLPARNASRTRTEDELQNPPTPRTPTVSRTTTQPKARISKPARNVEELPDDFLQMVQEESRRKAADDEEDLDIVAPPKPRSPAAQPRTSQRKPAFDGASLVSAVDDRVIEPGTNKFQTTFHGQTLYFTSERQRRAFEETPEHYWPALDGCCPLTLLRTDRREPGRLEHAAVFRGQVWLFATEEDMQEFIGSPSAVIEDVRAAGRVN